MFSFFIVDWFFLVFFVCIFNVYLFFYFLKYNTNIIFNLCYMVLYFLIIVVFCLLLGFDYLGWVFLIVYVGAIAVLFLFTIVMLNLTITSLYIKDQGSNYLNTVSVVIYFLFLCFFLICFF